MRKTIYTPEYAIVRDILLAARQEAGLSQRDVAARLKVPPSWVAKVELKERRVDVVEFVRILRACGANVDAALAQLVQAMPAADESRPRKRGRGTN